MTFPSARSSDDRLYEKIQTLTLPPLSGRFFRMVLAMNAEAIEETGPSFVYGGRYNPKGEFGALYFAETPALCWEEKAKFYQRPDLIPEQVLGEFDLHIDRNLDLTGEKIREILGVTLHDLIQPLDYRITQRIGRAAWLLGIGALKVPSSASSSKANIVVFRDHLASSSRIVRLKLTSYTTVA